MEVRKKIPASTFTGLTEGIFFSAMCALPWINQGRLSVFLLIALGAMAVFMAPGATGYTWYSRQPLFWMFAAYYALQVIAFGTHHREISVHGGVEQKASLLFVPLLLLVTMKNERFWDIGIKGFIGGSAMAALYCLISAIIKYRSLGSANVFFYHNYSAPLGLSAIYFSLDLAVALGFIATYLQQAESVKSAAPMASIGVFLLVNLLLLSSKMIIIITVVLLTLLLLQAARKVTERIAVFAGVCGLCLLLFFTANPVRARYANIQLNNYTTLLQKGNFQNYPFDGLSLRLLLWHFGNSIVNENKLWLLGAAGERYHTLLNTKISQYHLYTGNGKNDIGYTNYNMHNQYVEAYVQFGIIGLSILLALMLCLLIGAIQQHNVMLLYVTLLFYAVFITESALETQAGILLFTIITSGEWIRSLKKKQTLNLM